MNESKITALKNLYEHTLFDDVIPFWMKHSPDRKHGGYFTTEYGAGMKDASHPWEECRGIGYSFGYNRNESLDDYKSAKELVLMLVDIVSRGGNLLLDIGPTADGRIKPDVVAPGSLVWLPRIGTSGQYIVKNGTSFAAPLISGICALIVQAHPDWTPYHIMEVLKDTAEDLGDSGPDNEYGWGLPDAVKAVNYSLAGIERDTDDRRVFALNAPYPNPFNSSVNITFTMYAEEHISINIYDIIGRKISTVWDMPASPGLNHVLWNGRELSSGIYYVRAASAHTTSSQKMLFLK